MRGQGVALAIALGLGAAPPAYAQTEEPSPASAQPPTAEQFIETAREFYAVPEPEPEPTQCEAPEGNEIVVCAEGDEPFDQSLSSPTERAQAAGERPPDRIPDAPYVLGLPECGVEVKCYKIGKTPIHPLIIDFDSIPVALTPEEAALVFRAEDLTQDPASPEEASPAAAP